MHRVDIGQEVFDRVPARRNGFVRQGAPAGVPAARGRRNRR